MTNRNYSRYFRVFKNDTVVKEISTNDFLPLKLKPLKKEWLIGNTTVLLGPIGGIKYALTEPLFYGYHNRVRAMEMAKAGALKYIDSLIAEGEAGNKKLLQYREDHFEDLHTNLVFANIEAIRDAAAPPITSSEYVDKDHWV